MISVSNISKTFKLYHNPADRLKEIVLRKTFHKNFEALKNISFTVQEGETLGIVGENGAGKSTLLKILTGVLMPDTGTVHVDGRITGLLELGTGFNYEFSGVQNIYLNGTYLGMSRQEIDARKEAIIAFTELGDFIHEPLKTYSSGMVMRLAFSIAMHANPKAFVVDEALSVGDAYFQQKCMRKIKEFKNQGGAIVFVSHDMNAVKILCDKAVLLSHGVSLEEGEPDKIIDTYNFLLAKKSKGEEIRLRDFAETGKSYGNFKVEIIDVNMCNEHGQESEVFVSGEKCTIGIDLQANEDVQCMSVGILIRDRFGQDIFGTNTHHLHAPIALKDGQRCYVQYEIDELNIGSGKYSLTVAVHKDDTHIDECYQWIDMMKSFEVVSSKDYIFIGLSKLKPNIQVHLR